MWNKLKNFGCLKFLGAQNFINDLKKDERGLSGVVVAILLILVAVLAIVMIWLFLGEWLEELWDSITGQAEYLS